MICRNLVPFFLHEWIVVFTKSIFVITTIFIGHGIIPRILDRMVDFGSIFLGIKHEVTHFLTKRCYDITCCFLVDKVAVKSIIFGQINQLASDRECSVFVLLKGCSEFFLVCNTVRPVKEQSSQYRNTITVTSINHVWSWNQPFPEDHGIQVLPVVKSIGLKLFTTYRSMVFSLRVSIGKGFNLSILISFFINNMSTIAFG